ncbi:hypothetical protein KVR01_012893 [Diaporthe batatas]|uniref:uncharacterized protein n=1 Tax=Diaporthe batatas TaxID=748121 RepID=UPI001D04DF52|nr:uncharacterized protein KVR01_012893 [Diaporthe batatas]KAG8157185.1 hypothetical protein KVR01_012893 [Diaporthe batatas]
MMSDAEFETLVVGQGAKYQGYKGQASKGQASRADMPAPVGGHGPATAATAVALPKTSEKSVVTANTLTHTAERALTTANALTQTSEKTATTANAPSQTAEKTVTNANNGEKAQPFTPIPADNTDEVNRLARLVEEMDTKSKEADEKERYNRTVVISPLPEDITIADVLPRVRGGIDSSCVSMFNGDRIAVVTFKHPADAITYVEFCAETCIWALWTFRYSRPGVEEEEPRRAEVNLFRSASGMRAGWNRLAILVRSPAAVPTGTRCLVLAGCKPHEVAGIYRALGLGYSQHQRDQVEAMWLDGPARDGNGDPVHGRLHIWYTSIRAAQEAKMRWPPLEYEWDPCSDSPPSLILSIEEIQAGEVGIFQHSYPFVNLIEVNQDTIFNGVMNGVVDPARVYFRPLNAAYPGDGASLATRLQWSLQNRGAAQQPSFNMPPASLATPFGHAGAMFHAAAVADPFYESLPIAAGIPPRLRDDGATGTYMNYDDAGQNLPVRVQNVPARPQPPVAARAVQEPRVLGYPPYTHVGRQNNVASGGFDGAGAVGNVAGQSNVTSGGFDGACQGNVVYGGFDGAGRAGHSTNTNNTNNTGNSSNLGGNNPHSGRQPHRGPDRS